MIKNKSKIDIPVLLIFFNRPNKIFQVFEAVRKARPSRLYLYQDGPRSSNPNDIENVALCREAVSNIDWDCEVFYFYQKQNLGCDPSEYIAQKWFFSKEEMGIVLEDDDVPNQSFFLFCLELLEKYKDNKRIAIICGMNNFDVETSVDSSYFFSKRGSIWGWASWRRFIDLWDDSYAWLDDKNKIQIIKEYCKPTINFQQYYKNACNHKQTGRAHYESIMFAFCSMNNMLNIVPKYNMISNIGIDVESVHSVSDIRLMPKRNQKLFNKKTFEIDFPLKHPKELIANERYDKKYVHGKIDKLMFMLNVKLRKILFSKNKKRKTK